MDLPFKITKVRSTSRQRGALASVLNPVFGTSWKLCDADKYLDKLRKLWRVRVSMLHHIKTPNFLTKRSLQYARNCPPFGVLTNDKALCCQIPRLCPFCWGRRIALLSIDHLSSSLFGDDPKSHKLLRSDLVLVERQIVGRFVGQEAYYLIGKNFGNYRWRNGELNDYPKRRNGIIAHRLDLNDDESKILTRSTLVVVRAKYLPEEIKPGERRTPSPTRKAVADAVVRRCAYPVSVLRADPKVVKEFLAATKGRRFLTRTWPT